MQIGYLTLYLKDHTLEETVDLGEQLGFTEMEIAARAGDHGQGQIDLDEDADAIVERVRRAFDGRSIKMTALGCFWQLGTEDDELRDRLRVAFGKAIEVCGRLGVEVLTTFTGIYRSGTRKLDRLEKYAAPFLREMMPACAEYNVKIALENCHLTPMETPFHWARMFELVEDERLGLEFDPSHLVLLGIDVNRAVAEFGDRIFYTHAKDTVVYPDKVARTGRCSEIFTEWSGFAIPGYGDLNWGAYIRELRKNGYDGTLSLEMEDFNFPHEEGLRKGLAYLSGLI